MGLTLQTILFFVVHRLYFHPLSRYNGPLLWALTRVPYMLAFRSGQLAHKIKQFYEQYGDTVRVPNEVSFTNPDCLKTQAVAATPVDLQQWISYCTFDVICSLSFGEDFGCLEHNRYHEWVGVQVYSLNAKVQLGASRFYRSDGQASGEAPVFNAAIKEGIRLTSLVLLGLTRRAPSGGAIFCGAYFPEGTPRILRWSGGCHPWDRDTQHDRTDATQPFLQGPRDCLGQNLAKMEMALIVGRLLYEFDLSVPAGMGGAGDVYGVGEVAAGGADEGGGDVS
ncbi:hypothetical protein ATERTT37_000648 [Aspergillus terreus]